MNKVEAMRFPKLKAEKDALAAENERLRAILLGIRDCPNAPSCCTDEARRALEAKK